jgi:predicted dehydrogenase
MRDFLNAVRDGNPMKVDIEDGYKVAEMAEAIEKSYKNNSEIELPLSF